jgi:hypothetical protein
VRSRSILLALAVLLAAPSARAQDYDQAAKDVARRYAEEGIAAHEHGDYPAAVQSFTKAYRVLGAPTVGIRLARSLAKLGRLIEARKVYEGVIATPVKKDDPPVFAQAVTDARAELAELGPRIPTLEITLAPGVSSPMLDGAAVAPDALGKPTPIDPGAHRVGGLGAAPEAPVLQERDHRKLLLHPPLATATPPASDVNWRRITGISGLGLAGVSLIVGVAESLKANSVATDPDFVRYRNSTVTNDVCVSAAAGGDHPDAGIAALCDKAFTAELLQAIFYPAAAVFGGVGTYLLLTSGKPPSPPAVTAHFSPRVGPGIAGFDVTGTF